jgi:hypothetical protein
VPLSALGFVISEYYLSFRGVRSDAGETVTNEERMLAALDEIARWTRFMGLKAARDAITEILETDLDRSIYFLSNGASMRDIEEKLGKSAGRTAISARWTAWSAVGIMRDSARFQGRKEAVFTLAELGLPVPEMVRKVKPAVPEAEVHKSVGSQPAESPNLDRFAEPEAPPTSDTARENPNPP